MDKLSLKDLRIEKGQKILIRVDFNVPLNNQQEITDDSRIRASLPTIQYLLEKGASLILMSHLGRPKGKKNMAFSLDPCAKRLAELLYMPVIMAPGCIEDETISLIKNMHAGEILLLENLRFYPGEEAPGEFPEFVKTLADLGEIYVNDAFGTAHRFHASTAAITKYFPDKAAAGFLLEKEIDFLGETLMNPLRPFYAVIGGSKISTKIGALQSLLDKVDLLLIGGAMAFTFFKVQGIEVGDSLYEEDQLNQAKSLLELSQNKHIPIVLPIDACILGPDATYKMIDISEGIPPGWKGVDIGPKTLKLFIRELEKAKSILWNGPMGIFEVKESAKGTFELAKAVAEMNAIKIIGGGDSVAAVQEAGVAEKMTHLSTGGGATLEYIEYGSLPGIDALSKAHFG